MAFIREDNRNWRYFFIRFCVLFYILEKGNILYFTGLEAGNFKTRYLRFHPDCEIDSFLRQPLFKKEAKRIFQPIFFPDGTIIFEKKVEKHRSSFTVRMRN